MHSAPTGAAQADELTLCWAAWDPANALVELSKDFEKASGTTMKFEFVPWPNFADRMLNELNSGGKLCDLLIGDSQWIGGSAENGYYVKLNDFFDKEGIKMSDFAPATVYAYSTWPKGTPNYWALPAMGDANGWFYRKDWFEKPEIAGRIQGEVQPRPGAAEDLDRVQGRRPSSSRAARSTARRSMAPRSSPSARSEGITMGATSALYPYGFKYENDARQYDMEGAVNSADAVAGLEMYKAIYKCCTPPGYTDSYMGEGLDAFKSGQVAMMMNWFAFMPGMAKDEKVGKVTGFFVNPGQKVAASTLGGQGISVVANTDNMDGALAYIKWFAQPDVQKKWWSLGGYACHNAVLNDPGFKDSQPFAAQFLEAMGGVQDFWQEPAYASLLQAMQKRLHDYVVADKGTAKEALDGLIVDWTEIFEEEGKI